MGGGKDMDYNFYTHSGIVVAQERGQGEEEQGPVDPKSLMP